MQKTNLAETTIGFIGAGNMAAAIARGLIKQGQPADKIILSNPSTAKLTQLSQSLGVTTTHNNQQVCEQADLILLAVKPQKMQQVFATLDCSQVTCFISLAAGLSSKRLNSCMNCPTPLIRAMPNTPAIELTAATGLYADKETKTQFGVLTEQIFGAIGNYVWLEDEAQMDLVTALSGSGPAYFFLFMEALIKAATEQGLPADTAQTLVVQTALGAARLAENHTQQDIATLRHQVTSPGGTTEAALMSFQQADFSAIVSAAIDSAKKRSQELSNN